jgi:hypothetical protein
MMKLSDGKKTTISYDKDRSKAHNDNTEIDEISAILNRVNSHDCKTEKVTFSMKNLRPNSSSLTEIDFEEIESTIDLLYNNKNTAPEHVEIGWMSPLFASARKRPVPLQFQQKESVGLDLRTDYGLAQSPEAVIQAQLMAESPFPDLNYSSATNETISQHKEILFHDSSSIFSDYEQRQDHEGKESNPGLLNEKKENKDNLQIRMTNFVNSQNTTIENIEPTQSKAKLSKSQSMAISTNRKAANPKSYKLSPAIKEKLKLAEAHLEAELVKERIDSITKFREILSKGSEIYLEDQILQAQKDYLNSTELSQLIQDLRNLFLSVGSEQFHSNLESYGNITFFDSAISEEVKNIISDYKEHRLSQLESTLQEITVNIARMTEESSNLQTKSTITINQVSLIGINTIENPEKNM